MRLRIGAHVLEMSWLPTLLTLVLLAVLLKLGFWQLDRMREKQALFAEFAAGSRQSVDLRSLSAEAGARFQHAWVTGRYDSGHQILLDNMTHEGQVGYRVLTPLTFDAHHTVLVDRGWIPIGVSRQLLPGVTVSEDERVVAGRLDELPRAGIHLAAQPRPGEPWPRVLSYPTMPEVLTALSREAYPYILLLDKDQDDGFVREWRPATFPPQRHLGYAVTWFALAAALLTIYIVTHVQRVGAKS